MYWGVEMERPAPEALPRVRVTIGTDGKSFSLSMPVEEIRTRDGLALVAAWAFEIKRLPGMTLNVWELCRLLDHLESTYLTE